MTALVPDQLFRLLELCALGILTVGGIAIVGLLLSGLSWLREWWEARRTEPYMPKASGWQLAVEKYLALVDAGEKHIVTDQQWLDSEPFTGSLDWPQRTPVFPFDWERENA